MNRQLALNLPINIEATFENFCWHANPLLKDQIETSLELKEHPLVKEPFIYIWGISGSGKSHLLQACCQVLNQRASSIYLPLRLLKDWGAEVIEGIEEQSLICLDDIEAIAQDKSWEEALFHLYNRIRSHENTTLIITGNVAPTQLPIMLPDLISRLSWGLTMELHELCDEDKIHTLQLQANKRGFRLSNSVAQFLINRCSRNMHDLHQLLDQLDEASLRAQRKITIPFVKETLAI